MFMFGWIIPLNLSSHCNRSIYVQHLKKNNNHIHSQSKNIPNLIDNIYNLNLILKRWGWASSLFPEDPVQRVPLSISASSRFGTRAVMKSLLCWRVTCWSGSILTFIMCAVWERERRSRENTAVRAASRGGQRSRGQSSADHYDAEVFLQLLQKDECQDGVRNQADPGRN